jgi:FkbM family methyltransferase
MRLKSQWDYLTAQEGFRRAPVITAGRLISWRVRCLLNKPAITTLRPWNVQMFLPPQWQGIEKLIFAFRKDYEPELSYLERILYPGSVFADIGANAGIYTLVASKIVGEAGRVLAFEPSAQSFPILRQNIALNGLTNVLAFPIALAQKTGKARLYRGPNPCFNSLGKDPSWKEEVEKILTEPLDGVLHRVSITRVDVIKMDVQGAEELILRGARKILHCAHPVVIFEVFPEGTAALGLSPYGAWDLLHDLGYDFFVADCSGALSEVKSPPANRNVVAIYRQSRQ